MKIIDHTPYQDESGQINLVNRVQGTLKYGFQWYATLEAQKQVVAILNTAIEKGYTLVRNKELGVSGIIVPIVLIGTAGMYMIDVTALKGFYEARGNEWGKQVNGRFQPEEVNIIARAERLARVLEVFYSRQGVKLPVMVEPVLIASDPGMHITTTRPAVRVVMSDAIERFAANVLTARPSLNAQTVNDLVDRLITPRSANQEEAAPPPPAEDDPYAVKDERPFQMEPSRLQSILNAPKSDALIDTGKSDIAFALEDGDDVPVEQPTVQVLNPPAQEDGAPARPPAARRYFGMVLWQIGFLAFISLVEIGLIAWAVSIFF